MLMMMIKMMIIISPIDDDDDDDDDDGDDDDDLKSVLPKKETDCIRKYLHQACSRHPRYKGGF